MINLMYIVLTAMLALNVSSDVLNGFSEVERGVSKSNEISAERNKNSLATLHDLAERNPEKAGKAYRQAVMVSTTADSLYNIIDSLKLLIVKKADGDNTNLENIEAAEDLEAASVVMLNPIDRNGVRLKEGIEKYRKSLTSILSSDKIKKESVEKILSTEVSQANRLANPAWETTMFDNKPVIAAITLLSQLQNNIRLSEGEALHELLNSVDASDIRVNQMDAFVLPRSQVVMRGSEYVADIVLAAVDSTDRPIITINGVQLPDGTNRYSTIATTSGPNSYFGTLSLPMPDGTMREHPFKGNYTVIDPMATVSATMMNVLYSGIDNPISISVPGVPHSDISATATGGSLTRNGNIWIARPSSGMKEMEISVNATIDGKTTRVSTQSFKIRRLPDPVPFISITDQQGSPVLYRGGKPLQKAQLLASPGIEAAIDDGILNIAFNVNSFETVFFDSMGNAMVEVSDGPRFSQRQKDAFRRMARGKRFYISKVRATGPDGVLRELSPLEVIIN